MTQKYTPSVIQHIEHEYIQKIRYGEDGEW